MSEFFKQSISIAVCDDDPNDLDEIETMTSELLKTERISCSVSRYGDAGSLLSAVESGKTFDILLLDVMMENLNGIELAAALRRQGDDTAIVFISTNREMALLVNLAFIQSIRYCELTLKNGQVLPVSKYRQTQLKESFMRYLRR